MKNMDNFCYAKEAILCYHQIDTFRWWKEHKERHSEKIKAVALAIINLSEGISFSVSQSFSQPLEIKIP